MKLSEKLLRQFYTEVVRKERKYYKDIYQIKTLHSGIGDSIIFSCRFYDKNRRIYLFSIDLQLMKHSSKVRVSIHSLCPRRIFSKEIFRYQVKPNSQFEVETVMKENKYINYIKENKRLPYRLLLNTFNEHVKENTIKAIDIINEE